MNDLISRQAVLKGISLSCTGQSDVIKAEAALVRYVKKIPSTEPEQKKGKWLKGDEMPDYPRVPYKSWLTYCSECRSRSLVEGETDFCPNCGARMEE